MGAARPFAVDQAEGLRRMIAGEARDALVLGFVASSRDARVGAVMELLAVRLRKSGKTVLLVDEQSQLQPRSADVVHRPGGVGAPISAHRQQYDYILVDAYPSRDSYIHSADVFAITSQAPQYDAGSVARLLKAISRAPQDIGLVLTSTGEPHAVAGVRQAIETMAARDFNRELQWFGAIPTDQTGDGIASSLDGCIERLERIRNDKETADV